MKNATTVLIIILIGLLCPRSANSQNVGINATGATPNASAMLDVSSTTRGMLIPRMTHAQMNAIAAPATGLLVYDTDAPAGFYYYDGTAWLPILSTAVSANGGWRLIGNAGTVDGTNFLGTTYSVAFSIRVNNQKAGRIDPGLKNTFYGYKAGITNTTGNNDIFEGQYAGAANTTGSHNIA
ncbi:MAG TPA: hypothetical protein VFJ43_04410, partial [Bacteroidia bacterium]|nr:hypothetical protein [Bacteroidia bacterium]